MNKENAPTTKDTVENHPVWYYLKTVIGTALITGSVVSGIIIWFASNKIEAERFEANKQINELKSQTVQLQQEIEQLKSQPNLASKSKNSTDNQLQTSQDADSKTKGPQKVENDNPPSNKNLENGFNK